MKIKWIFVLILLLVVRQAYSQKNFGAQFKDWVISEAATDSRALAKSDYETRVAHTMMKINERFIKEIQLADSVLNLAYNQIERDEQAMIGLDTLQVALQRARSSRLAYYRLLEVENHLNIASKLKTNLDSIGSKRYFDDQGLYLVGRETLIESYASVGANFGESFKMKYSTDLTVSIGVEFDENGNVTSGSGGISQNGPGLFSMIGTVGGAIIGNYIGAAIGGSVGGTIDYFLGSKKAKEEQKKQQKEFKYQKRLLDEGLDALFGQLVPYDTLLHYYQGFVRQSTIRNRSIYLGIDSTLRLENLRFKEIFSYNVRRQQLSQKQLTSDRIAEIERNFLSMHTLQNFYINLEKVNFIDDCNLMIRRLKVDENWLLMINVNRFEWLQRYEAYQDDLKFALLLIQQFLDDENYFPYRTALTQRKEILETMAHNLPQAPASFLALKKAASFLSFKKSTSFLSLKMPASFLSRIKLDKKQTGVTEYVSSNRHVSKELHLVVPQSIATSQERGQSVDFGVCFGAGGYAVCHGNSDSYGGRFNNNGNSPIADILGSAYDGGLRSFSATATHQISAMRENIRLRVDDLRKDYSSLNQIIPLAHASFREQTRRVAVSAEQLGQRSGAEIRDFTQQYDATMPDLHRRLDQYMNQPVRTGLADLQRDLSLTRQVNAQVKLAEVPTSVFRIGGIDYGYQSAVGQTAVALAWEREVAKQSTTLQAIDQRVTDHKDPVFSDRHAFETFKSKLGQINQILARVNNGDDYSFEDRRQITSHYLAQGVKMRYAATGQLAADELVPQDYPFLEREQRDRLKGLVNEFKKCDPKNDDCSDAYGRAIYQIYRNNSVIGLANDEGQSFNAANLHQLATTSSEWQPIGPASSASAVNEAALLAMSGSPVIATRPDGMNIKTGIVLPVMPKPGTDGKWKGVQVPEMFYLDEDQPSRSFDQDLMSASFPDPNEVTLYTNRRSQNYNNVALTIKDKGVRPFAYSDPIVSDRATVPSLNFSVHTNTAGIAKLSEQTVPIAGEYVGRIVKQYGRNSRQVFENVYAHRDELFGRYPEDPSGLTAAQSGRLRDLRQKTAHFEDKERLLARPEDFYHCQTSRCLYKSCINELSKADPLDRGKILDYYNQLEEARVKYHDDVLNIGTAFMPFVNDGRDLFELVTGLDLITKAKLTYWDRGLSGAGLLIGSGAFFRNIGDLPLIRQNSLEIAKRFSPEFKIVNFSDKYYLQSKGGLYYERWDSNIGRGRFKKIAEDHFHNHKGKSYFDVENEAQLSELLDKAWKRAKDLKIEPVPGKGTNKKYIVDMVEPIGNDKKRFIHLIFDGTKEPGFVITAYPSKN